MNRNAPAQLSPAAQPEPRARALLAGVAALSLGGALLSTPLTLPRHSPPALEHVQPPSAHLERLRLPRNFSLKALEDRLGRRSNRS